MVELELEVENYATQENLKSILLKSVRQFFFLFNKYPLLDDDSPSGLRSPFQKDINIEILQLRMILKHFH